MVHRVARGDGVDQFARRGVAAVSADEQPGGDRCLVSILHDRECPAAVGACGRGRRRAERECSLRFGGAEERLLQARVADTDFGRAIRYVGRPGIGLRRDAVAIRRPVREFERAGVVQEVAQAEGVDLAHAPGMDRFAADAVPERRFAFDKGNVHTRAAQGDREGAAGHASSNDGNVHGDGAPVRGRIVRHTVILRTTTGPAHMGLGPVATSVDVMTSRSSPRCHRQQGRGRW